MNRLHGRSAGPISRRRLLEIGSLGLAGLGLADLLRLRAQASPPSSSAPDTAVILVWLGGGPSHIDTYDMKPEAPVEYRGEFKPIQTNIPGIELCELMPLHAKIADRFSLVRSISHDFTDHGGGHKRFFTGRIPKSPVGVINDAPPVPSIVAKMREAVGRGLPPSIALHQSVSAREMALGSAYLGPSCDPFMINGDPSDPAFKVQNLSLSSEVQGRLDDRQALLAGLDRLRRDIDRSGAIDAMDKYSRRALEILTSPAARQAFDLSLEDPKLRERYGHHTFGQRTLLARRLVEAGSSFVIAALDNPTPTQPLPFGALFNWDLHAVNGHIFNDTRFRMPYFDQAVTALIEDIYERGLDKRVMVIVSGEFGRTPRIEHVLGTSTGVIQPGRDHWPNAMSVLVSAGGMRMGQVIGSTNAKGEAPKDRPLTPNDLWATVYRHLGIDYTHSFLDHSGRPMPILPFGEPIQELI